VDVLCRLLGIEGTGEAFFEHVEEAGPGKENSHIDFWINSESGNRVVMEVKLSESDFGGASFKESAKKRLKTIYEPVLSSKVNVKYLEEKFFLENYQMLRNFYYIRPGLDHLFFLLPRENEELCWMAATAVKIAYPLLSKQTHVIYLEDVVEKILSCPDLNETMKAHYEEFRKKYVVVAK
jgi:hypothetical protein